MSGNELRKIPPLVKVTLIPALLLVILSGCCSYAVKSDVECPVRPTLSAIPQDLQFRIPTDALFLIAENQLLLKEYAKKLEVRAGCEPD